MIMMIIKEINNNNNYCIVHGVMHKHADSTKYAIIAYITNIGCIQGLYITGMDLQQKMF